MAVSGSDGAPPGAKAQQSPPRRGRDAPVDAGASVETTSVAGTESRASRSLANDDAEAKEVSHEEEKEEVTAQFEVELTDAQTWAMNFYECAAEGDLECLEEILESGHVGVDDVDVDGFTALMIAAAEGHRAVVHALLARGADTSVRTHELRSTALHFAAKVGATSCPRSSSGGGQWRLTATPMAAPTQHGDAEIVEALCARTDNVDYWNVNDDTPLIWACIEGRVDAVRVLLAHGAKVTVVNHFGAPPLLCAVLIGEKLDKDDSDQYRAEILRLLLAKDASFLNFQDREGSTAIHLAAACGHLECVKTLLELGADITLRNSIGQTPLEEAEVSDISGSSRCVDHLRVIWRQLEEEASARMIAMLEMEESAAAGSEGARVSSKKSKKKHKHKSGKRKVATAPKAPVAAVDDASGSADAAPTEERGPAEQVASVGGMDKAGNEPPRRAQPRNDVHSDENGDSDPDGDSGGNESTRGRQTEATSNSRDEPSPGQTLVVEAAQGVWTTVGKKHRGLSVSTAGSIETKAAASTRSVPQNDRKSPPKPRADTQAPLLSPKRATPVESSTSSVNAATHASTAVTKHAQAPLSGPQPSATKLSASPSMQAPDTLSGLTPRPAPQTQVPSGYSLGLAGASTMWRTTPQQGTNLQSRPSYQLQSPSLLPTPTSSIAAPAAVSGLPTASRFAWKHGHLHHNYPSPYYHYQSSRPGTQGFAREATTRWIDKLQLGNAAIADSLALLACGHCGELVDDNLQCSGDLSSTVAAAGSDSRSVCTQLYCSSCVARMAARAVHFTCVKCRRSVARALMRRNEFAQQQAASLALSINHSASAADTGPTFSTSSRAMTLDGMQRALLATVPRAEAVDLCVRDLVPGVSDLSTLSNGQLEVLDAAHGAMRQAIADQQIANARALERTQLLEWLKHHGVALPAQSLTPSLFAASSSALGSLMPRGGQANSSTPRSIGSWRADAA